MRCYTMATVDHFAAITWQYGADWCDFDYQEQDMAQHSSAVTLVLVLIIITKGFWSGFCRAGQVLCG